MPLGKRLGGSFAQARFADVPRVPSTTSSAQPTRAVSRVVGCAGGSMFFNSAVVLLATWLVALLLLAFLRS